MGESAMSGVESSAAESSAASTASSSSTAVAPEDGGGSNKKILFLVLLLLLIGLIIGALYIATSHKSADSDASGGGGGGDDDGSGSGGGGGGGGYVPGGKNPPGGSGNNPATSPTKNTPPSNPTAPHDHPTKATKATGGTQPPHAPSTKATGGTQPPHAPTGAPVHGPFSVSTLICTVNGEAVYATMLPKEGLCTMIVFCHVTIRDDGVYGSDNQASFEMFTQEMKNRKTTAGMSFDIRYTAGDALKGNVEKVMKDLVSKKIAHYGVLNVLDTSSLLKKKYDKAKDLLGVLKKQFIMNDATRKTMLAFGIVNFMDDKANVFEEITTDAMNNGVADIVIPLSTVSMMEREEVCFTFPPGMWDLKTLTAPASSQAGYITDLKTTAGMMDTTKRYTSSSQIGISIELGVLGYLLPAPPTATTADKTLVNSKCLRFFLTSMDSLPCKADNIKKQVFPDVNLAIAETNRSYIFLYEDEDSIKYKAQKLKDKSANLRADMAVLLMDVNLGSYLKDCDLRKHDRISVAKTVFGVK